MKDYIITAHSGCEGTPRNSLESVFLAIQYGADSIEVDVRIDETGVLRVSHDRKATQYEYDRCRTLREFFETVAQTSLRVNCDMKEAELVHEVIAMAKEYGLGRDRLMFTGAVSPEQLAREPGLRNDAMIVMNIEEIFKFLYLQETPQFPTSEFNALMNTPWTYTRPWMENITAERIRKVTALARVVGADAVNIPRWNLPDELFEIFAREEMPLSIWTVDDEADARKILAQKPGSILNITTRQVRMVMQTQNEIQTVDQSGI